MEEAHHGADMALTNRQEDEVGTEQIQRPQVAMGLLRRNHTDQEAMAQINMEHHKVSHHRTHMEAILNQIPTVQRNQQRPILTAVKATDRTHHHNLTGQTHLQLMEEVQTARALMEVHQMQHLSSNNTEHTKLW